jgi:hypothetical protein
MQALVDGVARASGRPMTALVRWQRVGRETQASGTNIARNLAILVV